MFRSLFSCLQNKLNSGEQRVEGWAAFCRLKQHCEGFKPTWNNKGYTREQKDRWTRHGTSGTLCPWPLTLTAVEGLLVPKHWHNLHTQMDTNQCMHTYAHHVHKTNTNTCYGLGSCSLCWHFGSDEVICVTLTPLCAHTFTHMSHAHTVLTFGQQWWKHHCVCITKNPALVLCLSEILASHMSLTDSYCLAIDRISCDSITDWHSL